MAVREVIANSNDLFTLGLYRKRFGSSVRDETRMNGIAHLDPRYQAYYRVRHYPAFD